MHREWVNIILSFYRVDMSFNDELPNGENINEGPIGKYFL